MQQLDFYEIFITQLKHLKLNYMVTGSIAAIFYGQPRLTHDIDLIIHIRKENVDSFCKAFPVDQYYCPPEDVIHIEINRPLHAHFNLIHTSTGLKADIYPFNKDKLHIWAFKNVRLAELSASKKIYLAPPEYVIIRKFQYFHEGGSEKHLQDIKGIISNLEDELDFRFIMKELKSRGIEKLWNKVA